MSKKTDFINKVVKEIGLLSDAYIELLELRRIYYDEEYNSGAADQITNSDCDNAGFSFDATELGNAMTLAQQLDNFMNSSSITPNDYDKTCNIIKKIL